MEVIVFFRGYPYIKCGDEYVCTTKLCEAKLVKITGIKGHVRVGRHGRRCKRKKVKGYIKMSRLLVKYNKQE